MTTAPYCTVSYDQPKVGRVLRNGKITQDSRSRTSSVQERINSLTHATDLVSALNVYNKIVNILTQITHTAPQVNNTYTARTKNTILEGEDHNPNYGQLDWIEEQRVYTLQKLVNPDDPEQFIEINVLNRVIFSNPNEDASLIYEGPL